MKRQNDHTLRTSIGSITNVTAQPDPTEKLIGSRVNGECLLFNVSKNTGFVSFKDENQRTHVAFVHTNDIDMQGLRGLVKGDAVTFTVTRGDNGGFKATKVFCDTREIFQFNTTVRDYELVGKTVHLRVDKAGRISFKEGSAPVPAHINEEGAFRAYRLAGKHKIRNFQFTLPVTTATEAFVVLNKNKRPFRVEEDEMSVNRGSYVLYLNSQGKCRIYNLAIRDQKDLNGDGVTSWLIIEERFRLQVRVIAGDSVHALAQSLETALSGTEMTAETREIIEKSARRAFAMERLGKERVDTEVCTLADSAELIAEFKEKQSNETELVEEASILDVDYVDVSRQIPESKGLENLKKTNDGFVEGIMFAIGMMKARSKGHKRSTREILAMS